MYSLPPRKWTLSSLVSYCSVWQSRADVQGLGNPSGVCLSSQAPPSSTIKPLHTVSLLGTLSPSSYLSQDTA